MLNDAPRSVKNWTFGGRISGREASIGASFFSSENAKFDQFLLANSEQMCYTSRVIVDVVYLCEKEVGTMWPMTLDVALALAYDRHNELLKTAQRCRWANYGPTRRAGWQRFLGSQLVRLGGRLVAWGANLRRDTTEYSDPTPLTTVG